MSHGAALSTWQRLCPHPCWREPTLLAIERELDRPETAQEIAQHEIDARYPEALLGRLRALGVQRFFAEPPEGDPERSIASEYHLGSLLAALARRSASLGVSLGVTGVAMLPVYIAGTADQIRDTVDEVLAGASAAVLLTEWAHGSDLLSNESFAERGTLDAAGAFVEIPADTSATHYRLFGEKRFINEGSRARFLATFARTRPRADDPAGAFGAASGFSLFLIARDRLRDDLTLRSLPPHRTLPVPAADIAGIELRGCIVPASCRLGREGEGFFIVQSALSVSRGGVAPLAAGLVTRARELAHAHARERVLYGASILNLGAIAGHLLRMESLDLVVNALALKGVAMINARGQGAAFYTAISKLAACQLAEEAVTEGRRVLGAHGLIASSAYERMIRDVVLHGVFDGTRHVMLDYIQSRLADIVRIRAAPAVDPIEILREIYHAAPVPLSVAARRRGRVLALPVAEVARALAALPGEVPLDLFARAAEALTTIARNVIARGTWETSQALRFDVAEVLAMLEAFSALVELVDPDRRLAIAPVMTPSASTRDRRLYRYAVGWFGSSIASRIREIALRNDVPLEAPFLEAERAMLSGQEQLRSSLIEDLRLAPPPMDNRGRSA